MSDDVVVEITPEVVEVEIVAGDPRVAVEQARAEAAEADLQDQIDGIVGVDTSQLLARSTDGSFGLSAPTGTGFEAIITANALQDFHMNGVAL